MSQTRGLQQSSVIFVTVCLLSGWYPVCAWADTSYAAHAPTPSHGNLTVDPSYVKLSWTPGTLANQQILYISTSINLDDYQTAVLNGNTASYFYSPGFQLGKTYYWRIDTLDAYGVTHTGDVWIFTTLSYKASQPIPEFGIQWVPASNASLNWQSGLLAVSHELYFSTDQETVEQGLASAYKGLIIGNGQLHYTLPQLNKGTTYYWRVDEHQSSGMIVEGDMWQFTTLESDGGIQGHYYDNTYLGEVPVLTRIDSEIDLNYSSDNALRRVITDDQFSVRWTGQLFKPSQTATTLSIRANDCVRLIINGQTVLEDWHSHPERMLSVSLSTEIDSPCEMTLEYAHLQGTPEIQLLWSYGGKTPEVIPNGPIQPFDQSYFPSPFNGAESVSQSPKLSWLSNASVLMYDLYVGTDAQAMAQAQTTSPQYQGQLYNPVFDLVDLDPGRTYYWRVDEIDYSYTANPGHVWQFTTADYYVIDNFEYYTNEISERIFESWIDGWGFISPSPGHTGNQTGSTVGYLELPYTEQHIVYSGKQSMPLEYNNTQEHCNSEATREFESSFNMLRQSGQNLSQLKLAFRGQPELIGHYFKQQNTVTLTGAGTGFQGDNDCAYFLSQSISGNATLTARIDQIESLDSLSQAGIMLRQSLDPNASQVCIAITSDGRLACHYRGTVGQSIVSQYTEPDTVNLPHWIRLQRQGSSITLTHSEDGITWIPQPLNNQSNLSLSGFASLGLMYCAYADNISTGTAAFSQVSSSSVTPMNTASTLGIPLNVADDLYIRLVDSQNRDLVIPHPDNPNAITQDHWDTWTIDLSILSGINLQAIKSLSIGVGSADSICSGGTGMIFIDDVGLHP